MGGQHTLQVSYELGVELLVVDILPNAQKAIARGACSLRNSCEGQQKKRKEELHL